MSQTYNTLSDTFFFLSSSPMIPATLRTSQLVAALDMKANFMSLILLPRCSMLPVIQVASAACDMNISVHVHSGETLGHAMIACSSTLTQTLKGCKGLKSQESCFFSFRYRGDIYPCALIHWFDKVGDCADEETSMCYSQATMSWPLSFLFLFLCIYGLFYNRRDHVTIT